MKRPFGNRRLMWAGIVACVLGCSSGSELTDERKATLLAALREHGSPPDDYLVSCFSNHDIVLLGENQFVLEDVRFAARVVPRLYFEAGVRAVAVEYLCSDDQTVLDSLVTSVFFERGRAIDAQRRYMGGIWPYQDYLTLYEAVWDVNRKRPSGSEPMRLIGLSPAIDWERLNHGDATAADAERRRVAGIEDHMASIVQREIVAPGAKALVYCGRSHAFSGFQQPIVSDGKLVRLDGGRMGNLLRGALGTRVFTVITHGPWPGDEGSQLVSPCGGILDLVLAAHADSVGFDAADNALGGLPVTDSVYRLGHDRLTLAGVCDGYVFHQPIAALHGVSVVGGWFESGAAFAAAKRRFPNPSWAENLEAAEDAVEYFSRQADVQLRFSEVH